MKLSDAYNKIINSKWTFTNNFKVQFMGNGSSLFNFLPSRGELNIVSYTMDSLTAEEQTAFTAGRHVSILCAEEMHTCSLKIRDQDQLSIYTNFLKVWRSQIYKYFDEYKFDLIIIKEPDYPGEKEKTVISARECYIFNVGSLILDNEQENQIFEFDLQIKCPNIVIDGFEQYTMPEGVTTKTIIEKALKIFK